MHAVSFGACEICLSIKIVFQTEILNEDKRLVAAIDYYFMQEDGTRFKVSYPFSPYFYVLTRRELLSEVMQFLTKKFSGSINNIEIVAKDDLDMVIILQITSISLIMIFCSPII